jgi:uncharacterized protein involved in outer membrane biogenesis
MKRPFCILLVVVSSLAVVAVAAVLLAWWLVDTDQVAEQLEVGLGEALDMDVQIGEPPRFGLLRGASVTLADLEMSRDGQVIARVESVHVHLALSSLLTGDVRPTELHLHRPEFSIERISPGVFNIQLPEAKREVFEQLSLRRVRLSDARLNYLDRESELDWQFDDCDLDLHNLSHAGGELQQALATLAANGDLQCANLSQEQFAVTGLSAEFHGDNGLFKLDPISAIAFEGRLSGRLKADLSTSPPEFSVVSSISQFEIGAFMAMLAPEQVTTGQMELDLDLGAHGTTWQDVRNSATGSISLTSGELVLEGYDLDQELDDYSDTQRFNLIDVGAVFLAGPIGLVASRGYAFTGMLEGSGGSTQIHQMVSEWTIESGVAQAHDVAFRTLENRLALSGSLDFTDYHFKDLKVAVLDREGCSVVEQRITGPFREPEVKQPNFLITVAGPLLDIIESGAQAITDEDCEAFYTGSIAHP